MKVKGIHSIPALFIVVLALSCAANLVDIGAVSAGSSPMLTVTVLQIIIIGMPCVFFALLRGHDYGRELRIKLIPVRYLTLTVYALAFTIFGSMALSLILYKIFPTQFAASAANTYTGYTAVESGGAVYAALSLAVVPAVLEEFLCRGIAYNEYKTYGAFSAVFMSSMCFAMLHTNFIRLPIYLITGVILALVANASGSIIASMAVHSAHNVFVLFLEPYIYKIAAKSGAGIMLMMFIVITLLLIFAILFFAKLESLYREKAHSGEKSPLIRKQRDGELPHFVQAVTSPTFVILAVFYIVLSIIG